MAKHTVGFFTRWFPIYVSEENGTAKSRTDNHHGHAHPTSDFPDGITLSSPDALPKWLLWCSE